ncbi:cytochrome P450 [Mycena sanguinolenta]|nr:cytochrome P450 [Mycena sanguinolenta]
MYAILRLALPVFATAGAYVLLQVAKFLFRDLCSPLRKLVGPNSPSFVWGNVKEMETRELYTVDTMAINHITKDNSVYQKLARSAKDGLTGEGITVEMLIMITGLLGVDGDAHRRQASLLARELVCRANGNLAETNYAFGSAQIHSLTEVFFEKSIEVIILDFAWMGRNVTTPLKLREVWARKIGNDYKPMRIDVFEWLSKTTLDASIIEKKLREELLTVATENPSLDELNSLPYLDSVVRETLRVYSPVSHAIRVTVVDDILPLATPCLDTQGRKLTSLPIWKGQRIRIPISDMNMDTTFWGDDAAEFSWEIIINGSPERWQQIPKAAQAIPGVWGNMLTFLAGPYNCIGFRFALAEQKVLLFVLIRAFEFERAVSDGEVWRSSGVLQSPFVYNEREKGSQMPLLVKAYQA